MSAPRRILAVKLASLGDLVLTTPALRAVRARFPDAHFALLATPQSAAALRGLDLVDETIAFDKFLFDSPLSAATHLPAGLDFGRRLRGEGWDVVLLLHHLTTPFGVAKYAALARATGAPIVAGLDNGRGWFLTHRAPDHGFGWKHEADYWLSVAALVGARPRQQPRLEIGVQPPDRAWAQETWQRLGLADDVLLLGPGSGPFSTARRWPVDRFASVARKLARRDGLRPVVLGGLDPDEQALATDLASRFENPIPVLPPSPGPGALAGLIERARLLVANDSGPVHLAAAVGTPVVAIFGPTNERAWGPYPTDDARFRVVREQVACGPCIHRGHEFGDPAGCAARTCLALLEPERVAQVAGQALEAGAPSRKEALVTA